MPRQHFKDWSIGAKLSSIQAGVIFLLMGLGAMFLATFLNRALEEKSIGDLRQRNSLVVSMLTHYFESVEHNVEHGAEGFKQALDTPITVRANEKSTVGGRETAVLYAGGTALNLNTGIIDRYTGASGNVATVFLRQGDDFIRVSTSVKNEKGERAVGTLLDSTHPAQAKLLAGETYSGLARLFGRDFMTRYTPVKDPSGRVIAALFVGFDITESFAGLKKTIRELKIGSTGYSYILDAAPARAGVLVVHPAKEGQSILDAKDADGHAFIKE